MANFAAVLVIIACPAASTSCIKEPVRVISYESSFACRAQREGEIRKASRAGFVIYGECNSIDSDLLAGKPPINIKRDVAKYGSVTDTDDAGAALRRRAFY
jgi:hypothetical protein